KVLSWASALCVPTSSVGADASNAAMTSASRRDGIISSWLGVRPLPGLLFHSASSDGHCKVTIAGPVGIIAAHVSRRRPPDASFASVAELVYGLRPSEHAIAQSQQLCGNGIVNSKIGKTSDAAAGPAQLHKKMLQLLSSLWVTRAVGTFARLGLADVMET